MSTEVLKLFGINYKLILGVIMVNLVVFSGIGILLDARLSDEWGNIPEFNSPEIMTATQDGGSYWIENIYAEEYNYVQVNYLEDEKVTQFVLYQENRTSSSYYFGYTIDVGVKGNDFFVEFYTGDILKSTYRFILKIHKEDYSFSVEYTILKMDISLGHGGITRLSHDNQYWLIAAQNYANASFDAVPLLYDELQFETLDLDKFNSETFREIENTNLDLNEVFTNPVQDVMQYNIIQFYGVSFVYEFEMDNEQIFVLFGKYNDELLISLHLVVTHIQEIEKFTFVDTNVRPLYPVDFFIIGELVILLTERQLTFEEVSWPISNPQTGKLQMIVVDLNEYGKPFFYKDNTYSLAKNASTLVAKLSVSTEDYLPYPEKIRLKPILLYALPGERIITASYVDLIESDSPELNDRFGLFRSTLSVDKANGANASEEVEKRLIYANIESSTGDDRTDLNLYAMSVRINPTVFIYIILDDQVLPYHIVQDPLMEDEG